MSNSSARIRLETIRERYTAEQQQSQQNTSRGLLLIFLCLAGLVACVTAYLFATSIPATGRVLLFLIGTGSVLTATVFVIKSLLNHSAGEADGGVLLLHPQLASLPGEEPAMELRAAQYGSATTVQARANQERRQDLTIATWSLAVGLFMAFSLAGWQLVRQPPAIAQPAENITSPAAVPGPHDGSELDGECCVFEDRPLSR